MKTWRQPLAVRDPRLAGCLAAFAALAFASCERLAYAEGPEERLTFHLDYQLLDEESSKICPRAAMVENLFSRIFGYPVIDPDAGPGFAIDVAYNSQVKAFEVVGHILRDDKYVLGTEMDRSGKASHDACFQAVYGMIVGLAAAKDGLKSQLKSTQGPARESAESSGDGFIYRDEMLKLIHGDRPRAAPAAPPATPAPPPKPVVVTVPAVAPVPWRLPQGFMLASSVTASVALLPTPSLGGMVGISYRKGAWAGGLEARFERGLVPAYLKNAPVDALYAGVVLGVPFVHQGPFAAGLVTEMGGYSFSTDQSLSLAGRFFMLAVGLRANLDLRVSEHFLVRGFAQASALSVSPYLDINVVGEHAWSSGPGFGSVGLSLVTLP